MVITILPRLGDCYTVEAANTANDVVNIAISQEGYIEKASNASLDDKTANAGTANYTKYHRDLGVGQGLAWCAYFVRWVLQTAGVPSSEYPTSGYVPDWQTFYINKGRYHARGTYIAKPGDLVIIRTSEGPRGHIGIVVLADNTGFFYTSGNTGTKTDRVERSGWMSQQDSKVTGWCQMNYNSDTTPPTIKNAKVSNITGNGYDVSCDVSDNVGLDRVEFPTWTPANGQDDLIWHKATVSNGKATFHVNRSDHKNEFGTYCTDIYAYDKAGNLQTYKTLVVELKEVKTPLNGSYNGHDYIVYNGSLTAAQARAKESGGYHLATITSEGEHNYIMSLVNMISAPSEGYWLGADDTDYEGEFKWSTREDFSYTRWPSGQPDNKDSATGGPENYLGIWKSGIWNDFSGDYKLGYILEKEPEGLNIAEATGEWNDHEYKISNHVVTALEARNLLSDGWYLATVTSEAERSYIYSLMNGLSTRASNGYWLGANDVSSEGSYKWENGEEFTYSSWAPGEPTNKNAKGYVENYLSMNHDGKFNDAYEGKYLGYILERNIDTDVKDDKEPDDKEVENNDPVTVDVESIEISINKGGKYHFYSGDEVNVTAQVSPANASDKTVTWAVSDESIARISSDGTLKISDDITDRTRVLVSATDITGNVTASESILIYPRSGYCNSEKTAMFDLDPDEHTLRIYGNGYVGYTDADTRPPFAFCYDIEKVYIEEEITGLRDSVFLNCRKITDIQLPEGLEYIGNNNFFGTDNLKSIVLPSSLKSIATNGLRGIIDVTFTADAPELVDGSIYIVEAQNIHVPSDAEGYYSWDNIFYDQEPIGGEEDNQNPTGGDDDLEFVEIPEDTELIIDEGDLTDDSNIIETDKTPASNTTAKPAAATTSKSNNTAKNNQGVGKNKSTSTPKYKSEWVGGRWYDSNGNNTYSGILKWKSNYKGWWIEDTSGWYAQDKWQKIDGSWYYFNSAGYMASGEWYNGYWFNSDGSWTYSGKGSWKSDSKGWWYEDSSGWYASNCWQKIDGDWYYFKGDGYLATSQYVDGWWCDASGVCR